MIIAKLTDHKRYEPLHPLLKQLFDYVCSHDFTDTPAGRIALQGDDLFVNLDESQLVEKDKQRLEVHRKYIDVHIPLTSAEEFGWRPLSTLGNSDAPFNCERDIAFYTAKSKISGSPYVRASFASSFPKTPMHPLSETA